MLVGNQLCIENVPYGGTVFFKPLASADDAYYIDSTIYPPNGTTLASENRVVTICLDNDTNADAIDLYNALDVQIENINIYGNRWNGTTGSGIVIQDSENWTDTNDVIENVVIGSCNGSGIWVQNDASNNVISNVQVFDSSAYGIQVDSPDNQFIDAESARAGLSGFNVNNGDNYFLNCISWGSGQRLDQTDSNGFSVAQASRNMFVGCDADRNARGGFVLNNASQTTLTSCIGRNNGQNFTGCWGIRSVQFEWKKKAGY